MKKTIVITLITVFGMGAFVDALKAESLCTHRTSPEVFEMFLDAKPEPGPYDLGQAKAEAQRFAVIARERGYTDVYWQARPYLLSFSACVFFAQDTPVPDKTLRGLMGRFGALIKEIKSVVNQILAHEDRTDEAVRRVEEGLRELR
ncbi:hypothetical protein ACFL6Y_02225 [Elusimicrobiota bacterium]